MKLKNIYTMGIAFSLFFAIFPLLSYIVAQILAWFWSCGTITLSAVPSCALWEVIYSLSVI